MGALPNTTATVPGRYFYLITFMCYLGSTSASELSFARWMADRKELTHLLSTLTMEPAV